MTSNKIESALIQIQRDSNKYKLAHINISNKSKHVYNTLTLTGILLGPILTVLARTDENCEGINGISVSVMVLGIMSGVIGSIIKFGKYPETISSHKIAAAGYSSLEKNIFTQLLLDENDRIPAKEYMEWIQLKFEDLFQSSPLLSDNNYTHNDLKSDVNNSIDQSSIKVTTTDRMLEYEMERLKKI